MTFSVNRNRCWSFWKNLQIFWIFERNGVHNEISSKTKFNIRRTNRSYRVSLFFHFTFTNSIILFFFYSIFLIGVRVLLRFFLRLGNSITLRAMIRPLKHVCVVRFTHCEYIVQKQKRNPYSIVFVFLSPCDGLLLIEWNWVEQQ